MIGIHTPETDRERQVDEVRRKASPDDMPYPIAVDNAKANWKAWGNHIWPAVYLIDRQGYIRYWWYGELKWQGRDGEQFMRERIRELLAEEG